MFIKATSLLTSSMIFSWMFLNLTKLSLIFKKIFNLVYFFFVWCSNSLSCSSKCSFSVFKHSPSCSQLLFYSIKNLILCYRKLRRLQYLSFCFFAWVSFILNSLLSWVSLFYFSFKFSSSNYFSNYLSSSSILFSSFTLSPYISILFFILKYSSTKWKYFYSKQFSISTRFY